MPLSAGDRLGPYEILSAVGKGGMGEVYRAHDSRLNRDVAIKVSNAQFTERFTREARAIAAFNHTNICHLYDVGPNYLVMEYIEGQDLRGPMDFDDALPIIHQLIDGIEAAHDKNIVHRDLKPSNIKITPEGVVKILDFGLAKATDPPPSSESNPENSPTLTMGATAAGTILGTAAYMAPEQAKGKAADKRSDIWSFGVIVYEILAGKRLFQGESAVEILGAVLNKEPDISAAPARVHKLLRWCLETDRKQRLQAIGDARRMLDVEQAFGLPDSKPRPQGAVIAAAVLAVIAAVALWGWLKPKPSEPRPITRFTFPSAKGPPVPYLSRDGSRIAQNTGAAGISLRMLDEFEAKLIPGTQGQGGVVSRPCFSPDGQWIAFGVGQTQLKKVPVAGGAAVTIADGLTGVANCDWGEDDNIYFQVTRGLRRVASSGGKPETLATADAKNESNYGFPQLLPGRQQLLFAISSRQGNSYQVAALDLRTKAIKILLPSAGSARYAPSGPNPSVGHIVYGRDGSLFAVPFDVNRLQVGSPSPVLEGVSQAGGLNAFFDFSDSGTLAYATGYVQPGTAQSTLVWVDRQGAEQAIPAPPRTYVSTTLSPDGGRVAVSISDRQAGAPPDIWIYDLTRGSLERRTFEGLNLSPIWTPDGKRLIYFSSVQGGASGLRAVPADGSGAPSSIFTSPSDAGAYFPKSISPDGKTLIGYRTNIGGADATRVLWSLPLPPEGSKAEARPANFLESKFDQTDPQFSPDGHWVAYQSNESGREEVLVSPFPGPGGKSQVSLDGGTSPQWNRNGRELFFRSGNKMMAVDVQTSPTFHGDRPKMLFETTNSGGFDVSPDGRRFLMVKPPAAQPAQQPEMHVVLNWFEELRRRAPLPK
jgi:serine/threonine protein kinase/Tol biopolymer transport system component